MSRSFVFSRNSEMPESDSSWCASPLSLYLCLGSLSLLPWMMGRPFVSNPNNPLKFFTFGMLIMKMSELSLYDGSFVQQLDTLFVLFGMDLGPSSCLE